jgi:hypothetical protein
MAPLTVGELIGISEVGSRGEVRYPPNPQRLASMATSEGEPFSFIARTSCSQQCGECALELASLSCVAVMTG